MTITLTLCDLFLFGMVFNYCLGGFAAARFCHKDPERPRDVNIFSIALIYTAVFFLWPAVLWVYAKELGEKGS